MIQETIKYGSNDTIVLNSGTYTHLDFVFEGEHVDANVSFNGFVGGNATPFFLPKNISIAAQIHQFGRVFPNAITGNLYALSKGSNFGNSLWDFQNGTRGDIIIPKSVGVSEKIRCTYRYYFSTPLNLKGKEKAEFAVSFSSGSIDESVVDKATAFLYVEAKEGIGVQNGIPQSKIHTIKQGVDSWSEGLGDGVVKIVFMNKIDSAGKGFVIPESEEIIKNVIMRSDKRNVNFNHRDLISQRYGQFQNRILAIERMHSFMIHDGIELNKTALSITFDDEKVAANENHIYVDSILHITESTKRAFEYHAKHFKANKKALKVS